MVRKGRKDIVQAIMKEAYLDRAQCREAGLSDFDLRIITNIFENREKTVHRNDYLVPVD
jgi:hypothetical protein